MVVRVAIQGRLERYLGRGNLKNGLLALVLVPVARRSASGTGRRGRRARPAEHGGSAAGVIRRRSQVMFYVAGARLSRFARIELRVLATEPADPSWRRILGSKPSERVSLSIDPGTLTCSQLTALGNQLRAPCAQPGPSAAPLGSGRQPARPGRVAGPDHTRRPRPRPTTAAPHLRPPPGDRGADRRGALAAAAAQPALAFSAAPPGVPVIDVNDQVADQRFAGPGAALTDSAAWLIYDELSSRRPDDADAGRCSAPAASISTSCASRWAPRAR